MIGNHLAHFISSFRSWFLPLVENFSLKTNHTTGHLVKNLFIFKIFLLLFTFHAAAQITEEDTFEDNDLTRQLWVSLEPSWVVGENQKIVGTFSYRTIWPNSWHRVIFRASKEITYDTLLFKGFKHHEKLLYGIGNFWVLRNESANSFEIRPFQGYGISFNLAKRFEFQQLLRLEERFLFNKDQSNDFFGLRLRYQVKGIIDFNGLLFAEGKGFYLPASIEVFFNLVKVSEFNDVIRISPGLGYQADRDFKIEAGLAYHYTKQGKDDDKLVRTNDIVFQFRIMKTFR